jgi:hypothetical protein
MSRRWSDELNKFLLLNLIVTFFVIENRRVRTGRRSIVGRAGKWPPRAAQPSAELQPPDRRPAACRSVGCQPGPGQDRLHARMESPDDD